MAAAAKPLKIATWNLDWFTARPAGDPELPRDVQPREVGDFGRLRAYADILDADVVAFEEVDGPEMAAKLFPAEKYSLHVTGDHVIQRVGIAVRRGIAVHDNPDDRALDVYGADAPHPLRSGADVTLTLPGGRALRVLAVHLKSGCQEQELGASRPACVALRAQIAPLQQWIAARQQEGGAFVVLGDFNRVMDADDPFIEALRAAAPLVRATEGFADPCWGGANFIDHILLGGDAIDWVVPGSLRVLAYRETDRRERAHLSDHCPVSVRLDPDRAVEQSLPRP